jgi:hypothetical protein
MDNQELNTEIAEKIMGWKLSHDGLGRMAWYDGKRYMGPRDDFTPYSDMNDAWEVVEKLGLFVMPGLYDGKWASGLDAETYYYDKSSGSEADTAPIAICLAALATIESMK